MRRGIAAPFVGIAVLVCWRGLLAADDHTSLDLSVPNVLYAVPGVELNVYFDNLVKAAKTSQYRIEVVSKLGTSDTRRWRMTPTNADVGDHLVSFRLRDAKGRQVGSADSRLRVIPSTAGVGRSVRLLVVGDSLTHASKYPNQLAQRLAMPGNPKTQLLGTHRPAGVAEGVAHEGYGGWTWQRFATQYEPNPDGTYRKRSSPFVFLDQAGKPQLDVQRYIDMHCGGVAPDVVVFLLGINDCFSADPSSTKAIDARIDGMFVHADRLLAAFRTAAPEAILGVGLTTPPNSRQAAFAANYQDRYSRWGWKRIQHRLIQRMTERWPAANEQRVSLIPTHVSVDPIDGYPENNAVHPNALGYSQIGDTMYAWLKASLPSDRDSR